MRAAGHCVAVERNTLPAGWSLARVREVGGLANEPRLLDAADSTATIESTGVIEPLDATLIIDCGGDCLVLAEDGQWYMGHPDGRGVIRCWGCYGADLDEALRAL